MSRIVTLITLFLASWSVTGHPAMAQPRPKPEMPRAILEAMTESDQDSYGMWKTSPNFAQASRLGIRVVNVPAFHSFFAYHLPPGFEKQDKPRAIIAVHGTGGTAYAEIKDEAEMADKLGYAVIAIQMRIPEGSGNMMPPRLLYGLIDQAVRYMRQRHHLDLSRLAYVGFSVGGAKSFQVAFHDRQSPHPLFSLIVNHSGLSKAEDSFLREIAAQKDPKPRPFQGLAFALYCGMKDEEWKTQQCDEMQRWQDKLAQLGAAPIWAIHDGDGKHGGYRQNPDHHESVMRWFFQLTE